MLCVENILAHAKLYDLWQVNSDAEYHEQGPAEAEETVGTGLCLDPCRSPRPNSRRRGKFGRASGLAVATSDEIQ